MDLFHMPSDREAAFADHQQPKLEMQIAEVLWRWKFAADADRDQLVRDEKLKSLIEYWFPFSAIEFTRSHGLWCDGIPHLEIKEIDRTSLGVVGVGCFPIKFAPFEIDFYFKNRRDLAPQSIILRFGLLDHQGELRMIGHQNHSQTLSLRPRENSDWAVAVELTEIEREDP